MRLLIYHYNLTWGLYKHWIPMTNPSLWEQGKIKNCLDVIFRTYYYPYNAHVFTLINCIKHIRHWPKRSQLAELVTQFSWIITAAATCRIASPYVSVRMYSFPLSNAPLKYTCSPCCIERNGIFLCYMAGFILTLRSWSLIGMLHSPIDIMKQDCA